MREWRADANLICRLRRCFISLHDTPQEEEEVHFHTSTLFDEFDAGRHAFTFAYHAMPFR